MKDSCGRNINYMRISITDRCNLRCTYCMPKGIFCVPMEEILTYEEITRVCTQAVSLGITRFKITGGEPLVRLGCPNLISMIKEIPGCGQVTMTTNGVLLKQYLPELVSAGLDAVNISLDTLDASKYTLITGFDRLPQVLDSIDAALASGLTVKINCVLQHGLNSDEWEDLLLMAKYRPLDVRFIELMPIGYGKGGDPLSNDELFMRIQRKYPDIAPETGIRGNGPAVYYRIPGFTGCVGFISPVHEKFCSSCNRIRLTSTGDIKPCLCYGTGSNVRELLRGAGDESPADDSRIRELLARAVTEKPAMHCFDTVSGVTESREMIRIGG